MNPSFSSMINLGDSTDYQNTQSFDDSQYCSNSSQVSVTESPHSSQNTENKSRKIKWDVSEDVALISAWSTASQNAAIGTNQTKGAFWARVKNSYDEIQAENPGRIGTRNSNQMKGRFARLSTNARRWGDSYVEAYLRARSGASQEDIEREAHIIYEQDGKGKFLDLAVYNEIMRKIPKWEPKLSRDTTRTRREFEEVNDESGGSAKRSRTAEEGDYSNPETPNSAASTIEERPIGRDATKKKGKAKVANELIEELRELRLARGTEVEAIKQLNAQKEHKREERERNKEERERIKREKQEEFEVKKMQLLHLNTLIQIKDLTTEEETMKRFLISKFYGN